MQHKGEAVWKSHCVHLAGLDGAGGDATFKLNTAIKSEPGVQNEAEPSTSVGSKGRDGAWFLALRC